MRAVAYCRFSTENQNENSIAYQLEAIQNYCKNHNLLLTNIYTDEAQSGTNLERDGFIRMSRDAEEKLFEAIIIYDQSRLSRNIVDWFTAREKFRKLNIKLMSCTESIEDADNPASFLTESMKAIISQHFVMETRKKIIAGQTSKAKSGAFLGGIAPLGYDIKESKYIINTYEAEAVHLIFELYASGFGYKYICNVLAEKGYKSKRGALIGTNAIKPILTNERYVGIYFWNSRNVKYYGKWAGGTDNPNVVKIEDGMPAIIDKKLWNEVQNRMNNKEIKVKHGQAKNEYMLSGLIRCEKCGASFTGFYRTNNRGYKHRYYGCSNRGSKKGCKCKNINANDLEILIITILKDQLLRSDLIEKTVDEIIKKFNEYSGSIKEKEGEIKKEKSDIDAKKSNLLKILMDGFDSQTVRDKIRELETREAALEQSLSTLRKNNTTTIDRCVLLKEFKNDSLALFNKPERTKELVHKYIAKIIISDDTVEITAIGDIDRERYSGRGI